MPARPLTVAAPLADVPRFSSLSWPGAVALLIGLLPGLRLVPGVDVFDGHRLLELAVLGMLAVWAAGRGEGLATWRSVPLAARWMLGAAVLLGLASSARAPLPRYGAMEVSHLVLLVAGACVLADRLCYEKRVTEKVVAPMYAGAVLAVLFVAVAYGMRLAGVKMPLFPEAGLLFPNHRFLNQVQTWTLPLLPLLVPRAALGRRLLQAVLVCWWMLLFASGGRASTLGMGVGMVVVAVLFRRRAWPWLRAQLGGVALGGVGYAVFFYWLARGPEGLASRVALGGSGRGKSWALALDWIRETPWLGAGPMHYAFRPRLPYGAHPHNAVLQWAVEWGVPAAVLLCAVALWAAWAWARRARAADGERLPVFVALTAVWAGAGTVALFDGLLVMPVSQLFGMLVGAWSLALYFAAAPPAAPGRPLAWRSAVGLAALVLALAVLPDVGHLNTRAEAYRACALSEGRYTFQFMPRFWQAGFLGDWTRTCSP